MKGSGSGVVCAAVVAGAAAVATLTALLVCAVVAARWGDAALIGLDTAVARPLIAVGHAASAAAADSGTLARLLLLPGPTAARLRPQARDEKEEYEDEAAATSEGVRGVFVPHAARDLPPGFHGNVTKDCVPGVELWQVLPRDTCSGMSCTLDEVYCHGVLVPPTTSILDPILSGNCTVYSLLCGGLHVNMYEQYRVENCTVVSFNCMRGTISSCAVQIQCSNFTEFGYDNYGFQCAQQQVVCDGAAVTVEQGTVLNSSNCYVEQVRCSAPSDVCHTIQLSCSADTCVVQSFAEYPCSNLCPRQVNTTWCVCPKDRLGATCAVKRPFNCSFTRAEPRTCYPKQSAGKDGLLFGIPACLTVPSLDVTVNVSFYLDCVFAQTPPNDTYNFSYWLQSDKFSISEPTNWTMLVVPYDFVTLSKAVAKPSAFRHCKIACIPIALRAPSIAL
eukprot:TRINITY_DN1051_c0_g1_i1.p1 TRINITY_DN1051_c0_g1~~TRINITY_DN1051_c0_g1_i1.p1  ORF type:complete len:446 (+),score=82.59 TRINITY_DN1051_c0_g1_i1:571-1908(+)